MPLRYQDTKHIRKDRIQVRGKTEEGKEFNILYVYERSKNHIDQCEGIANFDTNIIAFLVLVPSK